MVKNSTLRYAIAFALLPLICSVCPVAQADNPAQTQRLEGLSATDLERIAPELSHGPVGLVEFADSSRDQLPAINIAVQIQAKPETVAAVVTDPEHYPQFMPLLDNVEIIGKHDTSLVYEWAYRFALLKMSGRNLMTVYPTAEAKSDAPIRITVDSQEGDLGRGRYLYRIHPYGSGSVLVVSLRLDLRQANYIVRQLAKAARSVNRSANIGLGLSTLQHTKLAAEQREKKFAASAASTASSAPANAPASAASSTQTTAANAPTASATVATSPSNAADSATPASSAPNSSAAAVIGTPSAAPAAVKESASSNAPSTQSTTTALVALHKPSVDAARIIPLLTRGDVLLFEMQGDRLAQIGVIGAVPRPPSTVHTVLHDANTFGSALLPGSRAEIVAQHDGITTFEWAINAPLVGVSGQMQLRDQAGEVHVHASEGALHGGQWRFALAPLRDGAATLVTGWARFDLHNSTWLLEKLVDTDTFLGDGIVGAAELMVLRAARARAVKAEQTPATTP